MHRGPDNFPRKNVLRAIVMMTLAAMGYRPEDLPKTLKAWQARRRKTHRNLVPAAAAHLMVQANLNIITRAAMDDDSMYGRFLQLQRDFHQIMAGGNDGNGNGHGRNVGGQPFPSRFVSQSQGSGPGSGRARASSCRAAARPRRGDRRAGVRGAGRVTDEEVSEIADAEL